MSRGGTDSALGSACASSLLGRRIRKATEVLKQGEGSTGITKPLDPLQGYYLATGSQWFQLFLRLVPFLRPDA